MQTEVMIGSFSTHTPPFGLRREGKKGQTFSRCFFGLKTDSVIIIFVSAGLTCDRLECTSRIVKAHDAGDGRGRWEVGGVKAATHAEWGRKSTFITS
jgi:hypothetical protein